ncbi:hypothetical protein PGT21_050290 [Puccinia graminis f. sp. tritici]|uniref:Uncharacterized protein n=1 Tax=Puccinia graminis f. sp. tritici TaxID=56615 RepID=A0A5B0RAU6_PUCGR|nr:hypothetical protein PGT21_050290 [Puccinia graminis f. sp. tritici]KAA1122790.1 hypothetical protein PGTUg99_003895 [Puccinia graminis f. sp. tritici]
MLLTKVLVSLQLLHYYSISAHPLSTHNTLVKRALPYKNFFSWGSGSKRAEGDLGAAQDVRQAGANEKIALGNKDTELVAPKLTKQSEIERTQVAKASSDNVIIKPVHERSVEFLDRSLNILGVEGLDEDRRASLLKSSKAAFQWIENKKTKSVDKTIQGAEKTFNLEEAKSLEENEVELIKNFIGQTQQKDNLENLTELVHENRKYLGDLTEFHRELALRYMVLNFEKIKENTYEKQLEGLLHRLSKNKIEQEVQLENNLRPTFTELQETILQEFAEDVKKYSSSTEEGLKIISQGTFSRNFENMLDDLNVYGLSPFVKIIKFKNGKLATDQAEISRLAQELMESLPKSEQKSNVLEGIQYIDLINRSNYLKNIPQDIAKDMNTEQLNLLHLFGQVKLPKAFRHDTI